MLLCAVILSESLGASEYFAYCMVPETIQSASCGTASATHRLAA